MTDYGLPKSNIADLHSVGISYLSSYWLRDACKALDARDPVDALDDCERLVALLRNKLAHMGMVQP
jgi:hypothetical protein